MSDAATLDLSSTKTDALIDELENRIHERAVEEFVREHAEECLDDHVDDCDTDMLIEAIDERAVYGDDEALRVMRALAAADVSPPRALTYHAQDDIGVAGGTVTGSAGALRRFIADAALAAEVGGIPVLGAVRLAWDGQALTATCTDLGIQMETRALIDADDAPFVFVVGVRRLRAALDALADDIGVTITRTTIHWEGGLVALETFQPDDFPQLAAPSGSAVALGAEVFSRLTRIAHAISTEETRYYLNGVFFDPDGLMVVTDGHRLLAAAGANWRAAVGGGVIVPRSAVAILTQFGDAAFVADGKYAAFSSERHRLTTKLIDGAFPDWRRVLPAQEKLVDRITVSAAEMRAAAKVALALSEGAARMTILTMAEGKLRLEPKGDDAAAIAVCAAGGAPAFALNAGYLVEMLAALDGDLITMALVDNAAPITFLGDPTITAVLMPQRI